MDSGVYDSHLNINKESDNMKKLVIISILTVSFLLTACSKPQPITPRINGFDVNRRLLMSDSHTDTAPHPSTLKEITEEPHAIIIGEFCKETEQEFIYRYDEYFEKDVVYNVRSYNDILVTEVLKGDLKIGDKVEYTMAYAIEEREDGNYMLSWSNYISMHKGDRWIFFLYEYIGEYIGRYRFPVPDKKVIPILNDIKALQDKQIAFLQDKKMFDNKDVEYWKTLTVEKKEEIYKEELAEFRKSGDEIVFHTKTGDIYRLSAEDYNKYEEYNEKIKKIGEKLDLSFIGMNNYDYFFFSLYVAILEHFNIEAQDYTNPGRVNDKALIGE
jgi:hypothetical protein